MNNTEFCFYGEELEITALSSVQPFNYKATTPLGGDCIIKHLKRESNTWRQFFVFPLYPKMFLG
jgi:hypothetical protein